MAHKQAVSKPLLAVLVVVALIGAFMLARSMMDKPGDDEVIEGLPTMPEGFNPKPPPNEPGAAGGG
jgi:hypothetical protein